MSSICVKEESDTRLHLSIEPTATSWAMALGVFSFVIGFPLYNYDCMCLILLVWVLGTAALLAFFNPWQEVMLDKEKRSLVINRQNFFQRYNLKASTSSIYELDGIRTVNCESSCIVFALANFQTIELNVKGESHVLVQLVEKIRNFLQLEENQTKLGTPSSESEAGSLHSEATNEDSSSATSDDSFERIDSTDLADYESSKLELDNDIPSDTIQSLSPSSEDLKELASESEKQCTPLELTPVSEPEEKFTPLETTPISESEEKCTPLESTPASAGEQTPKSAGDLAGPLDTPAAGLNP